MNPLFHCRILFYGHDGTLLYLRRLALERDGWIVDVATSPAGFNRYIETRLSRCGLILLCHTIPRAEKQSIRSAAKAWRIQVHSPSRHAPAPAHGDKVATLIDRRLAQPTC